MCVWFERFVSPRDVSTLYMKSLFGECVLFVKREGEREEEDGFRGDMRDCVSPQKRMRIFVQLAFSLVSCDR